MQRNKRDTFQINAYGAKHHGEAILVHPMAYHAKVVVSGHGQGAADPLPALLSHPLLRRWHGTMLRWWELGTHQE
jgi:hypothetical protein